MILVPMALIAGLALADAPAVAVRAAGVSCDDALDGSRCASGVCWSTELGAVCTSFCATDADCPASWMCRSVPQGTGEPALLCAPRRVVMGS